MSAGNVQDDNWRVELGEKLKEHLAFQNLLRDINRLGKAANLDRVAENATKWVRDAAGAPQEFLQVRTQLWVRELRRIVANVSSQAISLRHADDLSGRDKGVFLPVIHCRDCHVMGWGAVRKAGETRLLADLQTFYDHFFNHRIGSTFLFPTDSDQPARERVFERIKLCGGCNTLNDLRRSDCLNCGGTDLLMVEIPHNRRQGRRNNGAYWHIHHDCPYCGGKNSLTILGSQSASLSSVMIGQIFASSFAFEKKLIAFSDSVQDAAHRAGFSPLLYKVGRDAKMNPFRSTRKGFSCLYAQRGPAFPLVSPFPRYPLHRPSRFRLCSFRCLSMKSIVK